MALVKFKEQKPIILAAYGYHPFIPDAGIYCGGYQGPLYPNPTTLIIDNMSFDWREYHEDPIATEYEMKSEGDVYEGLGLANPNYNYRNPGHILGVMDTFNRMSYAMGILKSMKNAEYQEDEDTGENNISPIIDIIVPFIDTQFNDAELTPSDLYPDYCEKPSDYIKNFVDEDGLLLYNPYIEEPFNYGENIYHPETDEIDLEHLFYDKMTFSYPDIRDAFEIHLNDLYTVAMNELNDATETKLDSEGLATEEDSFNNVPPPRIPLPSGEDPINTWPTPDEEFPYMDITDTDAVRAIWSHPDMSGAQLFSKHKAKIITPAEALYILTGDAEYHQGKDVGETVQLDYRSLTELNSVINMIPIQTNAFYQSQAIEHYFLSYHALFPIRWLSWIICDVVFTTNVQQEITFNVVANIQRPSGALPPDDPQGGLDVSMTLRQFRLSASVNNNFVWNRGWFNLDSSNQANIIDEKMEWTQSANFNNWPWNADPENPEYPGFSIRPEWVESTDFEAEGSLNTDGTGQTVRIRFVEQVEKISGFTVVPFHTNEMSFTLNVQGNTVDLSESMILRGV